ncbi:MAG: hypothetical protein CM1200mP3_15270 [Chloroflexota bacterium]|nr:MAG: hypothetical protein CM1200mP3_15270 [Chloroflexota bacterium]
MGNISEVLETGANDVYVIHSEGEKDILIPAIFSVVTHVDIMGGLWSSICQTD